MYVLWDNINLWKKKKEDAEGVIMGRKSKQDLLKYDFPLFSWNGITSI
jgi:hypothetical protein